VFSTSLKSAIERLVVSAPLIGAACALVKNAPARIRAIADPTRFTDMVTSFRMLQIDGSRTG
jgi:hypothetical protein